MKSFSSFTNRLAFWFDAMTLCAVVVGSVAAVCLGGKVVT